jgi:hypothetical protein
METTHREDWRLACSLPATMDGQEVYIKLKVPPFTIDNKKIGYGLPNACALYLGNAYKLYIQSKEGLSSILCKWSFC